MNINTATTIPYSEMPAMLYLDNIGDYITARPIEYHWESPYERLERRIEALEAKLKLVAPYIPEDIDIRELL